MKYIFAIIAFIALFICFPPLLLIIPIAYIIITFIIASRIVNVIEEVSDLKWNTGYEWIDIMMDFITNTGSAILVLIIWVILLVIGLLLAAIPVSILT